MRLRAGDTIGVVCPSHIADRARHERSIWTLKSLGYNVVLGDNVYRDTYGYLASEMERADDFNHMVRDDSVKLVLFGGGEGGNELLPYIDYDAIIEHPKLYMSFSDGTTILTAIHSMTGLTAYYGQGPGMFYDLRQYDYMNFLSHMAAGHEPKYEKSREWTTLNGGVCSGELVGGYTRNFAMMLGGRYFSYDAGKKYLLFLEDYEKFSEVAAVSSYISHIEQSDFIGSVSGLMFGHYSEAPNPELLGRLKRFGEKYGVPVVYCDDFGHGVNHAILPIGAGAELDADGQSLKFL